MLKYMCWGCSSNSDELLLHTSAVLADQLRLLRGLAAMSRSAAECSKPQTDGQGSTCETSGTAERLTTRPAPCCNPWAAAPCSASRLLLVRVLIPHPVTVCHRLSTVDREEQQHASACLVPLQGCLQHALL